MDFQTRDHEPMISIQMPTDMTETSRGDEWAISMPSSDLREPLFEKEKRSAPPPPPKDTNNITGFEKLLALEGVYIDKNYSSTEVPCCCCKETCSTGVESYSYKISDPKTFGSIQKGQSGDQILRGIEEIPDFDDVYCTAGRKAFYINVQHQEFDWRLPNASAFLRLERKFKWSCLCINRPEMIVTLTEGNKNERLGRIVNPIQCGVDFRVKIYDASETLRYVIKASCCSCGVVCPGYMSSMTVMDVCDGFGNVEGKLRVLEKDMVPQGVRYIFSMDFPKNANGADRALLIAAIMMVGKIFFEPNDIGTNFCEIVGAFCDDRR